ncbi:unnamed protein product [Phytomonas sp. EM1]|nr:unnamed protein product [Phytomonas sp. EM1]|eukprot:CCW63138.1 unnamed protein product [Phytomonas sp. isolate EM1]
MCLLPNTRSRFEEFASLRENARALSDQEKLVCAKAQPPSSVETHKQPWNPPWLRALEEFSTLEKTVKDKIKDLVERQQTFFNPNFLLEEEEAQLQKAIDSLTLEIRKLIKELERMALSDVNPRYAYKSDELMIHGNVKRYLCSRLKEVGQVFKNAQDLYVNLLKQRWRKKQRYMKFGSDETHEIVSQEERSIPLFEMGYSEEDIQELITEYKKNEKIDEEVKQIIDTLKEIHELFNSLNELVTEQGENLDRIDCSIKWASDYTLKGKESLKKAQECQRSHCALM